MWRPLVIVLLVASCNTQQARPEPAPASHNEEQPAAILLGPIDRTALGGKPYGIWFDEQYGGYALDTLTLAQPKGKKIPAAVRKATALTRIAQHYLLSERANDVPEGPCE